MALITEEIFSNSRPINIVFKIQSIIIPNNITTSKAYKKKVKIITKMTRNRCKNSSNINAKSSKMNGSKPSKLDKFYNRIK